MSLLATLLLGCRPSDSAKDTAPPASAALIIADLWADLPLEDDPLPAHQPDEVECLASSWYVEYTGVELDTSWCNYLSLTQPLALSVAAGEPLSLLAWHQSLLAEEAAVSHMALLIDGLIAWEVEVPIPADAGLYEVTVPAPADAPAGAAVVLHLHNHGYNAWAFNELTALR